MKNTELARALLLNNQEPQGQNQTSAKPPPKSFQHVDEIIYARVRFLILEKLLITGMSSFSILLAILKGELADLTTGNLSGHLAVLEDAKYIRAKRAFKGRRPTVVYSVTDKGKEAFELFLTTLIGRLQNSKIEILKR